MSYNLVRRQFLTTALAATSSLAATSIVAASNRPGANPELTDLQPMPTDELSENILNRVSPRSRKRRLESIKIDLLGDGLNLTPAEYSNLLHQLVRQNGVEADFYCQGGIVAELETRFAKLLGKEMAVFLPTGTLANHLALRLLAAGKRVLVPLESHVYNDSGDGAQILSGMNLIPVTAGQPGFTVAEIAPLLARNRSGRVATPIGAILVETPVRRQQGAMVDYQEIVRLAQFAREQQIPLHLDGARLFLAAAYTGIPLTDYCQHFDTVYVSLYKYFNAAAGAILAGPKALLADLFHTRRMFGGSLAEAWPYAAVANHYLTGFLTRFQTAIAQSEKLIAACQTMDFLQVERVPQGSNIFYLNLKTMDATVYRTNLAQRGVLVRPPVENKLELYVNETLNRLPIEEIITRFRLAGK
jgi:threonine aldolase